MSGARNGTGPVSPGVLAQAPRLVQLWHHEHEVEHAAFSAGRPPGRHGEQGPHGAGVGRRHGRSRHASAAARQHRLEGRVQSRTAAAWSRPATTAPPGCGMRAADRPFPPPCRIGSTVVDVSFSPDGRRVVTAGTDGMARVWDAATGRTTHPTPAARELAVCRGIQPGWSSRRHRQRRPHGAGLGRGHRPASRPGAEACGRGDDTPRSVPTAARW